MDRISATRIVSNRVQFFVTYAGYKKRSWQPIAALAWRDRGCMVVNNALLLYPTRNPPTARARAAIRRYGVVY